MGLKGIAAMDHISGYGSQTDGNIHWLPSVVEPSHIVAPNSDSIESGVALLRR
jgi:hypothetical protein